MKAQHLAARDGSESSTLITVTEVAEQVGREILESRLEPGAWATALYECGGKRQDALAMYARLRVRKLTKQRRIRLAKVRSFESRRLNKCMGDQATRELLAKTIQEMLDSPKRGSALNFMKPKLSVLWLMVLFIGAAGTTASLARLHDEKLAGLIPQPMSLVALLAGVAAVAGAVVLRYFLPKRWVMLGWNSGLVVACNVVCLSSLFFGTKVIRRAIAADTVVFPTHQTAPAPVKVVVTKPSPAYLVSAPIRKDAAEN